MGLLGGEREELQEAKAAREAREEAPEQQWEYLARNLDKVAGMALEDDFNKHGENGWSSSPSRRTTRSSSGPSGDDRPCGHRRNAVG